MYALVVILLISVAFLMILWVLFALVRQSSDDSPFAAPESPAIESFAESEAEESTPPMTSRN
jgi:hypothetical protein